jgi:L-malate glycosyltransferase
MDQPVPVLYVSASGRVAGSENSLLELVAALDRSAWAPRVALPGTGSLRSRMAALGVPCAVVPLRRLRRSRCPVTLALMAGRLVACNLRLRRRMRRDGVGLVHVNGFSALAAVGPVARLAGLPCVLHLRDLRFPAGVARLLTRTVTAMIVPSCAVADAVRQAGLAVGRGGLHIVPNGIDVDAFAARAEPGALRAELGLADDAPLLLVAAQIVPWKGHERFLRAFAQMNDPTATAVIAGADLFGDHPGCVERLQALAAELGVADAVRFLGNRDDMPTLMRDADVLVVPSDAEPFGRVALEAMSVGTPVVGLKAGGLPEVVEQNVTGLLTEPDALADAMRTLLADAHLRHRMGRAARKDVRQRFSIHAHAAAVGNVYAALV